MLVSYARSSVSGNARFVDINDNPIARARGQRTHGSRSRSSAPSGRDDPPPHDRATPRSWASSRSSSARTPGNPQRARGHRRSAESATTRARAASTRSTRSASRSSISLSTGRGLQRPVDRRADLVPHRRGRQPVCRRPRRPRLERFRQKIEAGAQLRDDADRSSTSTTSTASSSCSAAGRCPVLRRDLLRPEPSARVAPAQRGAGDRRAGARSRTRCGMPARMRTQVGMALARSLLRRGPREGRGRLRRRALPPAASGTRRCSPSARRGRSRPARPPRRGRAARSRPARRIRRRPAARVAKTIVCDRARQRPRPGRLSCRPHLPAQARHRRERSASAVGVLRRPRSRLARSARARLERAVLRVADDRDRRTRARRREPKRRRLEARPRAAPRRRCARRTRPPRPAGSLRPSGTTGVSSSPATTCAAVMTSPRSATQPLPSTPSPQAVPIIRTTLGAQPARPARAAPVGSGGSVGTGGPDEASGTGRSAPACSAASAAARSSSARCSTNERCIVAPQVWRGPGSCSAIAPSTQTIAKPDQRAGQRRRRTESSAPHARAPAAGCGSSAPTALPDHLEGDGEARSPRPSATTGAYRECVPFASSTGTSPSPPRNAPPAAPPARGRSRRSPATAPPSAASQHQPERHPVDRRSRAV